MMEILLVTVVFIIIGYFNYKAIIRKSDQLRELYYNYYFKSNTK